MSNATKPRKYYFVDSQQVNQIPLAAGNVIALLDVNKLYYDVEYPQASGQLIRRDAGSNYVYKTSRPTITDIGAPNTIYICSTGEYIVGTSIPLYEIYIWEDETWALIASNHGDVNVTSIAQTAGHYKKYYLTGSELGTSTTGTLTKRDEVYVDVRGKLYAPGGFGGEADSARNATNAQSAQQAINDNYGNPISLYYKDVASGQTSSGITLTFTRGTAQTSNITIPIVSSNYCGVVPKLPASPTANTVLYYDGWKDIDVTGLTADKANKDSANQWITSTYIKSLSFNNSNRDLTVTKGDDTTSTVNIPDTTYSVYSGTTAGLVRERSGAPDHSYLRVDGSWAQIPVMSGATQQSAGSSGLVPTPEINAIDRFLKGDGSWADAPYPSTFVGTTEGLVPSAVSASSGSYLSSNGQWVVPENTATGALDISDAISPYFDIYSGDSSTTSFTLQYIPESGSLEVSIDNVEVPSTDYTLVDDTVTFNTAPEQDSVIRFDYSISLASAKLYLVGAPNQVEECITYTDDTIYMQNGSVYINNAQVATLDDNAISSSKTWSSDKINTELQKKADAAVTLSSTLTAGQTTVTISDPAILATSLIQVFADVWYSNAVQSAGSVVLTFPVQASDLAIKVRIS